jgi:hypothetical protein
MDFTGHGQGMGGLGSPTLGGRGAHGGAYGHAQGGYGGQQQMSGGASQYGYDNGGGVGGGFNEYTGMSMSASGGMQAGSAGFGGMRVRDAAWAEWA